MFDNYSISAPYLIRVNLLTEAGGGLTDARQEIKRWEHISRFSSY